MIIALNVLATLVIAYWAFRGLQLVRYFAFEGSAVAAGLVAIMTLAQLIPLVAVGL